jgi:hypothetical protein
VCGDVIRVGVADEHGTGAALSFPRVEPEADLREKHSGAGEFDFKRHGLSVGNAPAESNPAVLFVLHLIRALLLLGI